MFFGEHFFSRIVVAYEVRIGLMHSQIGNSGDLAPNKIWNIAGWTNIRGLNLTMN